MANNFPKKIIIRTPNWLGDLMMSTAFIHAVLKSYPEAQVDLIVKAGFEQIPLAKRGIIHIFDKSQQAAGRFGMQLRPHAYDRFYILPPSFSAAWMAFWSGASERIGHRGHFRSGLLKPSVAYAQPFRTQHLIQEYLELLNPAFSAQQWLPRLDISPQWAEHQLNQLETPLPEKFIAIAPGAIYGPAKQWPIGSYRRLVEKLVVSKTTVVLVGTQKDYQAGKAIAHDLNLVHNWCGITSLTELIAVLAKAHLLISNDSGSMHIMTALQRPQIAIFGSTSQIWTKPLNPKATTLAHSLDCSPCFQRTCRFGHYDCLRQITPQEVFATVEPWLV